MSDIVLTRDHIKHVLRHYIRLAWEATGLKWDWDNDSEVDALADAIIDAAVTEALEKMRAETDSGGSLVMPRINGQAFRCLCGNNVFRCSGDIYTCTACMAQYTEGA